MEENMTTNEAMETEALVPKNDTTVNTSSSGSSTLTKLVVVGAVSAVAGAAAFGLKKLKERNEKKTIEKLKKKGWQIEVPEAEESEDIVDGEVVSEEEDPEETEKESK